MMEMFLSLGSGFLGLWSENGAIGVRVALLWGALGSEYSYGGAGSVGELVMLPVDEAFGWTELESPKIGIFRFHLKFRLVFMIHFSLSVPISLCHFCPSTVSHSLSLSLSLSHSHTLSLFFFLFLPLFLYFSLSLFMSLSQNNKGYENTYETFRIELNGLCVGREVTIYHGVVIRGQRLGTASGSAIL